MRIIERVDPEVEITCPDCKSRLAATMDDIRRTTYTERDGTSSTHHSATCAVCLSEMDLPAESIPTGWLTRVRSR